MTNRILYIVIIVILVGYSCYESILYYRTNSICESYLEQIQVREILYKNEQSNVQAFLDVIFLEDGDFNMFADDLAVEYDINGKLICFFRNGTCLPCILGALSEIDSLVKRGFPIEKVILIGQSIDENMFTYPELVRYNKEYSTIWINKSDYFRPLAQYPFYFIAKDNELSKHLFVPDLLPYYKKQYFDKVISTVLSDQAVKFFPSDKSSND